jgi:hypothetical protein
LAAAGVAKLFAPYAQSQLFESILLRIPLVKRLEPFVALRLVALLELLIATALVLGGRTVLMLASVAAAGLYATFAYANWLAFRRRLPCPCFGLDTDRPVSLCKAMATSFGFVSSLYVSLAVFTDEAPTALRGGDALFYYVAALIAGVIVAITAWSQVRAEVEEVIERSEQELYGHGQTAAVSRRSLLTSAPMIAAGMFGLPSRLLRSSSAGGDGHRELPAADASHVRDFTNVKRLLERTQIVPSDVDWRNAFRAAADGKQLGTISFLVIPVIPALGATTRYLLVAPKTGGFGHAAALWDGITQRTLVAVMSGWLEVADNQARVWDLGLLPDGVVSSGPNCGNCLSGGGLCCTICGGGPTPCCAACAGGGVICCAVDEIVARCQGS